MKKNLFVSLNTIFITVTYTVASHGLPHPVPTDWLRLFHVHHGLAYKKSPQSQIFSDASEHVWFDSEYEAFCADLNLNEFKEIVFIGCLILNILSVIMWQLIANNNNNNNNFISQENNTYLIYDIWYDGRLPGGPRPIDAGRL